MRILVVHAHPVPESFGGAVRDEVMSTLSAKGHELRLIDLYALGFDPVMRAGERSLYYDGEPSDPELRSHIEAVRWAEGVVFVYPTWWCGLPAILKGWFDRVWALDVAFRMAAGGGIVALMTNIRLLAVVTTCGASLWESHLVGHPGRRTILSGIRAICAPGAKTLFLAHYGMDRSTPKSRAAYLGKVRRKLARV
ncbi:NAD(P)H-dependent oxidoreductase [Chelatococcus sambhunathii]|uniref:NAD(P)H-dependent oxidoreductase n=1 Tax=Chelatococcus sambhunathii TaxID=363953 RepID=A0ABU1DCI4_9HYPH|nr:NAD(P)H-dependent oxidoreductase [Chelatococcus sambhunathii]MDR4305781.1 NAD(P)H-dependent oxidoreductase [Chelatococcus sambhunathii]